MCKRRKGENTEYGSESGAATLQSWTDESTCMRRHGAPGSTDVSLRNRSVETEGGLPPQREIDQNHDG